MTTASREAHELDRFLRLVRFSEGTSCWEWAAHKNKWGYGNFKYRRKVGIAHRFAYEQLVGPIPKGFDIDHLCRVRHCVNPEHLEPVTRAENVRRGLKGILKTHCKRGHEYTESNTYRQPSKPQTRQCRKCNAAAVARYQSWRNS